MGTIANRVGCCALREVLCSKRGQTGARETRNTGITRIMLTTMMQMAMMMMMMITAK